MNPWIATATISPEDAKPLFTPNDSLPRDILILICVVVAVALTAAIWAVFFRKRHHRRHEHRPRNPTRAETGGLPPARTENSANPGSFRG